MALTFGAANTDDATIGLGFTVGSTGTTYFISGWFRPTTLTAGRALWSLGALIFAAIDSTDTSELLLTTDNTTDGNWTTTGAAHATNTWRFFAFMNAANNTGPTASWRAWAGDEVNPPVELTLTNTVSPSGNFTGNANLTLGNKASTGTAAYQGDIAEVSYIATSSAGALLPPFGLASHPTIAQAEADWIYSTYVVPIWMGRADIAIARAVLSSASNVEGFHVPLHLDVEGGWGYNQSATTLNGGKMPSVSGATTSSQHAPRACPFVTRQSPLVRRP